MAVSLACIRDEILPGLFNVRGIYEANPRWEALFADELFSSTAPFLSVMSLPDAAAMGVAAAVIANPVVSRRKLLSWWRQPET